MLHVAIMPQYFGWAGGLEFLRNIINGLCSVSSSYDIKVSIALNNDFKKSALFDVLNDYLVGTKCSQSYIYYDAVQTNMAERLMAHNVDIIMPVNGDLGEKFSVPWISYLPDFQHRYLSQYFTEHECFSRETAFAARLRDCKSLIVNAKTVKKDLKKFYPWVDEKRIFSLPFTPSQTDGWLELESNLIVDKYCISSPYFIVCNQFWLHKDHTTAFKAFSKLNDKSIHLVCTGSMDDYRNDDYIHQLKALIDELDLSERIHLLGHIPKTDQINLLKGAIALVQPTHFEGGPGGGATFDAVAIGTPAILSDIDVNKEIELESVCFFNVGDADSLAVLMEHFLTTPCQRPDQTVLLNQMQNNQRLLGEALYDAIKFTLEKYK